VGKLAGKVVTGADSGIGLAAARASAPQVAQVARERGGEAVSAGSLDGCGLTLTPWIVLMAKAWDGEVVDLFAELLAEVSPAEAQSVIALMGRLVDRFEARDVE
jgi:NAD(P)-dependent dehydrogenase (short-subunit alcohol dehydrogenase family)